MLCVCDSYDPVSQAAEVAQQHERRRGNLPTPARRIPIIEDVVGNAPLTNNRQGYSRHTGQGPATL